MFNLANERVFIIYENIMNVCALLIFTYIYCGTLRIETII